MFLLFISTANIYCLINDLLHPKNLVYRADGKGRNSPISQEFFVYICIFVCICMYIFDVSIQLFYLTAAIDKKLRFLHRSINIFTLTFFFQNCSYLCNMTFY